MGSNPTLSAISIELHRRRKVTYAKPMSGIRAKVKRGRLVLNQPTNLPEGTTLDLVLDDEGDELSPQERKALDRAIAKAWSSAKAGKLRSIDALIRELRARA